MFSPSLLKSECCTIRLKNTSTRMARTANATAIWLNCLALSNVQLTWLTILQIPKTQRLRCSRQRKNSTWLRSALSKQEAPSHKGAWRVAWQLAGFHSRMIGFGRDHAVRSEMFPLVQRCEGIPQPSLAPLIRPSKAIHRYRHVPASSTVVVSSVLLSFAACLKPRRNCTNTAVIIATLASCAAAGK